MPSKSIPQRNLFGAALGGAKFPAAEALRRQMTIAQLRDFASTTNAQIRRRSSARSSRSSARTRR